MNLVARIFKNSFALVAAELIGQVFSFFLILYIARYLGDVGLGKYSFAYAFAGLFFMLADMGLFGLSVRNIAHDKKETSRYVNNVASLKFILGLLSLALTMFALFFTDNSNEMWLIVLLAGTATFFTTYNKTYVIAFRAYEKMEYEAIVRIIERIIVSLVGIYCLVMGYGLIGVNLAIIGSYFTTLIMFYFISSAKIVRIGFSFDFEFWKFLIRESIPFWLIGVFEFIYFRIDTVMLSVMKDYAVTGWYSAAYRIIEVLMKIPVMISAALFPTMARLHAESVKSLQVLYQKVTKYLWLLAFPVATGGIILSKEIIGLIYKEQFNNSVLALQILMLAMLFIFVNYFIGNLLMAINLAKVFMISTGICALFNVLINLALIPYFSYAGAAWATVMTEALNFTILFYYAFKHGYKINLAGILYKPIIACAIMAAVILLTMGNAYFLIKIAVGIAVYFLVIILLGGIGKEEIEYLKEVFRKEKPIPTLND